MNTFYNGSDIPLTIIGDNVTNLDNYNFSIKIYIYSNKSIDFKKEEMKQIAPNSYYITIPRAFTATMGSGIATLEIRLFDNNNLVDITKNENAFTIKDNLIGRI